MKFSSPFLLRQKFEKSFYLAKKCGLNLEELFFKGGIAKNTFLIYNKSAYFSPFWRRNI